MTTLAADPALLGATERRRRIADLPSVQTHHRRAVGTPAAAEIESGPQNQGAVQSLLGVQRDNGAAPGRPGRPGRLSALWQ